MTRLPYLCTYEELRHASQAQLAEWTERVMAKMGEKFPYERDDQHEIEDEKQWGWAVKP